MQPNTNETNTQKNVIKLLQQMGYIYIIREDNVALRNGRLNEVIFKDILIEKLQELNSFEYKGINYQFSPKNIARAVEELNVPLNEGLLVANQKISDKLILGTSYEEELIDGDKKSFSLRYIDFTNAKNNIFHVSEEFSVSRQLSNDFVKNRRPDLVLFINGIPFAVIELKKSSIMTDEGISQMIRNQCPEEIPQLFKYIQLTMAANNHTPKYATVGTPDKFYAIWNEDNKSLLESIISGRMINKLDQTIYSLLSRDRVLEVLHSFVIFDKRVKKIARYQQYFAINKIKQRIEQVDTNNNRAGGLVWHTQGSGKSLTMVMLCKVLKRDIPGSRIIIVTDRKDLDIQIHTTFQNSEIKAGRAGSGRDLIEKLQSGISVITTLIHKFETVKNERITLNDPNIFILVDESHRTQNGSLHRAMRKVFPMACYIGFTGTPLLKAEKSSMRKFGGIIHQYPIKQAVEDKAVLPLLYEGRMVEQWINDEAGLDRKFELISRDLNDKQKLDLKHKWARFKRVAASERRLEMIALDINEHFKHSLQGTGLKAMLATNSKYEAFKYHELFELYGDIKSMVVVSAPDSREGFTQVDEDNRRYVNMAWNKIMKNYASEDNFLESIKSEFIDGDDLEILIVVDKLLTGFDAEAATVLYIDKELKEHNLLQAIARVNRLYSGKDGKATKDFGFIIDYRGLLKSLDQALTSYDALAGFDEADLTGTVIDIRTEIAKLKTFYSHLRDFFAPVINKKDQESYEVFLSDEGLRREFYELLSRFARALKLALSSDKLDEVIESNEIMVYKNDMKFYNELRKSVKLRYSEEINFDKYEKQMQKLLDTYISANEVNRLTKLVNIFDESFEQEITRMVGDNARADTILNAVSKVIREKEAQNPELYGKLSKKIKEILAAYKEGRLTDEDKLKSAFDIRQMLISGQLAKNIKYPKAIAKRECAKALFDNLKYKMKEISDEDFLQAILQIDDFLNDISKKPDWQYSKDAINELDQKIDDILFEIEKVRKIKFNRPTEIIELARSIGINNYAR